jgi:hypothetical protein
MRWNWTLRWGALAAAIAVVAMSGCDPSAIISGKADSNQPLATDESVDAAVDGATSIDDSAPAEPQREVASPELTQKGHLESADLISTPVNAYFSAQAKLAFDRLPNEIQKYKLLSPDGKGPQSYEELVEKVIKPCGIKLPELRPGDKYVYDPMTEQLMIQHPAKK